MIKHNTIDYAVAAKTPQGRSNDKVAKGPSS